MNSVECHWAFHILTHVDQVKMFLCCCGVLQRNGSRCRSIWMKQLGDGLRHRTRPARQSQSWSSFRCINQSCL